MSKYDHGELLVKRSAIDLPFEVGFLKTVGWGVVIICLIAALFIFDGGGGRYNPEAGLVAFALGLSGSVSGILLVAFAKILEYLVIIAANTKPSDHSKPASDANIDMVVL